MKNIILVTITFLLLIGCTDQNQDEIKNNHLKKSNKTMKNEKPRVTGIGGIFFKSENPDETKDWYSHNLGLNTDKWGTNFEWFQGRDPSKKGYTQWSPISKKGNFFEPSGKEFMINYRVVNLEKLLEKLKQNGVTILDDVETFEYGKFVHILDNEGNKIELWEPNDTEYNKLVDGRTK
jgi:predicted enzyme related to lactoylglutathione lyase